MSPNHFHVRQVCALALALAAVLVTAGPVKAADWPLIAPSDLASTKPRVDPAADAEVLLWDVRVTDSDTLDNVQTVIEHHLRIKIFTDRGREAQSKVDLTYTSDARVRDVEGRTVSSSGAITELRGQDVFDRTIIQASGYKIKAKSFVLPAVTPGSIIDYRWREIRDGSLADGLELPFHREIPVQLVRYHVKPLALRDLGYEMRTQQFNMSERPTSSKEERGYTGISMTNVPALKREPYMPPSLSVGPWMLLYYVDLANADKTPDRFWQIYGKDLYTALKPQIRVSGSIRQAAAEATKGASSTADKIDALVRLVRTKVKRDADGLRRRRKENKDADDTLSRGIGDSSDQNILFTALATAASLDARLALLPDRSDFLSRPEYKQPYFIRHMAVAVRDGEAWRFIDVGNRYAMGGQLAWKYEGQYALLLDEKSVQFVNVPLAEPARSMRKRTAAFKLADDGTLEGQVTLEYTGQFAAGRRDDDDTVQEREQQFKEDMVKRLAGAEISGFAIENPDNPDVPYVIKFTMRVPGYGQRAGSRLLVQPAVMQRGAEAMLSATARQYHIYFPYAWTEQDTVTIDLPSGYEIEPDAGPQPAGLDGGNAGLYQAKVALTPEGTRVTYTRWFELGSRGNLLFQPSDYASVKGFLGVVDRSDAHTIVLRRRSSAQQ